VRPRREQADWRLVSRAVELVLANAWSAIR